MQFCVLKIKQWCEEAGGDITIRHILRDPTAPVSITDDRNPFWVAFKSAADELLDITLTQFQISELNFVTILSSEILH